MIKYVFSKNHSDVQTKDWGPESLATLEAGRQVSKYYGGPWRRQRFALSLSNTVTDIQHCVSLQCTA